MSKLITRASATLLALTAASTLGAQAAPPATDIFLAPLRMQRGNLVVGTPVNVTNRPGYDNQPSFTPDSRTLFFTSVRGDAQADIYKYDLRTKATARVTTTPESEYSATAFGDGSRFSVVRVEADSTQRLWSFRLDGSDPRVLFDSIKPVGYHAWVDSTTVAMFLLGRPNALVLADTRGGRPDTLARDVGRSLQRLPNGNGFSFLQRAKDSSWVLTAIDVHGSGRERRTMVMPLVRMPAGADYITWVAPAVAIAASGSTLLIWRGSEKPGQWTELADLAKAGLTHTSRLALSPDHHWLAIVAEPAVASNP
jgi:dipeptidyl aminopeptidase/acylaminoacyl peptidase